ncbi:MAG TPA: sulfatase-like hydrolase/transferase [Terriglobia bacterium]|nr:sulfatase-like hydrolase/transferase [Terriglobia bacterium]
MVEEQSARGQSRRNFLAAGLGSLAVGLAPVTSLASGGGSRKPNILIILTDQEREDIPRHIMRLPNREVLESHGIRFTRAFCTAPQCSASRAAMLTGLYPHEAGVVTNVDKSSLGRALSPQIPTLGKVFQQAGYKTGYLGKWHLRNGIASGCPGGNDNCGLRAYGFDDYRFFSGAKLAGAAADWIRNQSSEPWLLIVSFPYIPHNMYTAVRKMSRIKVRPGVRLPENFDDDLRLKPPPQEQFLTRDQGRVSLKWGKDDWLRYRTYYLQLIEEADSYVGVILGALHAASRAEDTIVVYSSDHGDMGGAHHLPFKGPFMYDELLRVPLTFSCPRLFPKPVVSNSLVSTLSLAPTLCSMAGTALPAPVPGKDISILFSNPRETVEAEIFAEYYSKQHWVNPIRTIRTLDWKYNLYVAPGQELYAELYHLRDDPGELHNLARDPSAENARKDLRHRLLEWRMQTHDPLL